MTHFKLDSDIRMDKPHSLDQLTSRFQGVKDGLPELVKNSKDQYGRLAVLEKNHALLDKATRNILVLVSPDVQRLAVLDFGGAKEADFDGWAEWSSRTAGRSELGADIEAGYGNGGKSFMVRGALKEAYMCSVLQGRVSKRGFQNDNEKERYKSGWAETPQGKEMRALTVESAESVLNDEIAPFKLTADDLPKAALEAFRQRKAFTIVQLVGVKDWQTKHRERLVRRIPEDLANHAQTALSVETCSVWVMVGPDLLFPGPLEAIQPEPQPGFDALPPIPVPSSLPDPETGEKISTGSGSASQKFLQLRTSRKSLRLSQSKALNYIRVRNDRNIVGNWPVSMLAPAAIAQFIYGTVQVPALVGDNLAGSDRQVLADTPLVRALQKWVEGHVNELAEKLQKAHVNREAPEDRTRTNDALKRLRELMRKYLEPDDGGDHPTREYGSQIDVIELEPVAKTLTVPVGTTVPVVFKCYEKDGSKLLPIQKPKVQMVFDPPGQFAFNGFGSVAALKAGTCKVYLQREDGLIRSNEIVMTGVEVSSAMIEGPVDAVKQGQVVHLDIRAIGPDGRQIEGVVYETTVDELDMGRVGRTGVFTGGQIEGAATIRVKFAGNATATCQVTIGPDKMPRKPPEHGDIPLLLLCGQTAPGKEDLPESQRTHPGGENFPTIIDWDPVWEDVVWLNPTSHEAQKVRLGGPTGTIRLSSNTFYEFLALKCFEVLQRLKVRQEFKDKEVTTTTFLQAMAQAETDMVAFLGDAFSIVKKLLAKADEDAEGDSVG